MAARRVGMGGDYSGTGAGVGGGRVALQRAQVQQQPFVPGGKSSDSYGTRPVPPQCGQFGSGDTATIVA